MYSHGTWTQWSLGRVTHVTSTDRGQRSSRGQWPLVQVFGKKVSVSTYFDVFSNLILQRLQKYVIAKAGETLGSRTALSKESTQFWPNWVLFTIICPKYTQFYTIWVPMSLMKTPDSYTKFREKVPQKAGTLHAPYTMSMWEPPLSFECPSFPGKL